MVWFRGNTGERFRLETTFNGIKEYFHGCVQQVCILTSSMQGSVRSSQIDLKMSPFLGQVQFDKRKKGLGLKPTGDAENLFCSRGITAGLSSSPPPYLYLQ